MRVGDIHDHWSGLSVALNLIMATFQKLVDMSSAYAEELSLARVRSH